jgi:hypothetical protein
MKIRKMSLLTVAMILVGITTTRAVNFSEVGDAGQLPGTAQGTGNASLLTSISGSLASNDVDLYKIYITDPAHFMATTVDGASFDTLLFLFSATGHGIYANDDSASTLQSTLPAGHLLGPTSTGLHYLGISRFGIEPVSADGLIFPTSPFSTVHGPTGPGGALPLTGWAGSSFGGSYTIFLRGVAGSDYTTNVPDGGSTALMSFWALAVIALAARRCRITP